MTTTKKLQCRYRPASGPDREEWQDLSPTTSIIMRRQRALVEELLASRFLPGSVTLDTIDGGGLMYRLVDVPAEPVLQRKSQTTDDWYDAIPLRDDDGVDAREKARAALLAEPALEEVVIRGRSYRLVRP